MSRPLTVVIEKSPDSDCGAWAPKLPGCVAVGKTEEEAFERMKTAVLWHFQAGERRSAWAEVRDLEVTELLG
jgi:predicted RNase H-like HicB family nuclease